MLLFVALPDIKAKANNHTLSKPRCLRICLLRCWPLLPSHLLSCWLEMYVQHVCHVVNHACTALFNMLAALMSTISHRFLSFRIPSYHTHIPNITHTHVKSCIALLAASRITWYEMHVLLCPTRLLPCCRPFNIAATHFAFYHFTHTLTNTPHITHKPHVLYMLACCLYMASQQNIEKIIRAGILTQNEITNPQHQATKNARDQQTMMWRTCVVQILYVWVLRRENYDSNRTHSYNLTLRMTSISVNMVIVMHLVLNSMM